MPYFSKAYPLFNFIGEINQLLQDRLIIRGL